MTTETAELKKPEKKIIWSKEERDGTKEKYGCELLIESGSLKDVSTKNFPTDAYVIKYVYDDNIHYDLTRGTKVNLFDMYWDKFKSGLKSIDYGMGTIKPNLWRYQSPKTSKKKRKG
tara:strand:- start:60 stop:410 length:351 start_codon:yes stop_codon:yes gene_type:complete